MADTKEIGYVINIGLTSCRLFTVLNDTTLKEGPVTSYSIADPSATGYLDGIIKHVKSIVLPHIESNPQILIKVFVDTMFSDVFNSPAEEKDFIRRFYEETNLYFNILSREQMEINLNKLFGEVKAGTIIVNIDSRGVDVLEIQEKESIIHRLPIRLDAVDPVLKRKKIGEIWDEQQISIIKDFIKSKINKQLKGIKAEKAIIIKDELSFMQDIGYPLIDSSSVSPYISVNDYKKANREKLFSVDYLSILSNKYQDKSTVNRFYGFKRGHLILETIIDAVGVSMIFPSNQHSVHGDINAYIFKVVLSGSTNQHRIAYMVEANTIMKGLGATVLSPSFIGENWSSITTDSDYEHLKAIDNCDVLFICNKDQYVGESTKCEIYYAYGRRKTIAFWNQPDNEERFSFIPHEHWEYINSLVNSSQ